MKNDPIVAEVRKARQTLEAQANHNLQSMFEAVRKRQAGSGRRIVTLKPRRPKGK